MIFNSSQQKPECDHADGFAGTERRLFSWWYVWVPIIVAVTLWIGGWWFGNYGDPWSSKPPFLQPKISDPAIAMRNFSDAAKAADRVLPRHNPTV